MQYVYPEPAEYGFKDVNGHDGKFFGTDSPLTNHLIIECNDKLTVSLMQNLCEFNYYILEGSGYFMINDEKQSVAQGDLVVVPAGTKYSFGGKLKMFLVNTPHWSPEQETIIED